MIKLLHGDCLELMQTIEDGSIDAIITDPPYGTTACKWDSVIPFEPMWEQLNRIIKPNGAIVLFGSEPFSSYLRMSNIKNYKYDWIWDKIQGANIFNLKYQPFKTHEIISVFCNGAIGNYNPQLKKRTEKSLKRDDEKSQRTIYSFSNSTLKHYGTQRPKNHSFKPNGLKNPDSIIKFTKHEKGKKNDGYKHPTRKPEALMRYLIKTYTNEGETVLDFTMGSGTTGVAAKQTNRKFIGIEKEEKYFNIAQQRINSILL